MIKKIYIPCKGCVYELIADRTIYYMKKYHKFDIIKTYLKPADFYIGECDVAYYGIVWCDKPGKNNVKLIDDRKIIVTSTWLKEYMEKEGVKVEQVIPFGVDDELAQKHVNFDFNARRGYISTDSETLKAFEGRRKQLTLIGADFQPANLSEDLKYYLLSHSLFYIALNDGITPIEAMSVGTPLVYMRNRVNPEYACGIEIDDMSDLKKIEISKEEWEDLSYKCWFKSLRYHYITIGQELWGWLK